MAHGIIFWKERKSTLRAGRQCRGLLCAVKPVLSPLWLTVIRLSWTGPEVGMNRVKIFLFFTDTLHSPVCILPTYLEMCAQYLIYSSTKLCSRCFPLLPISFHLSGLHLVLSTGTLMVLDWQSMGLFLMSTGR
jgi:hypothetical protein